VSLLQSEQEGKRSAHRGRANDLPEGSGECSFNWTIKDHLDRVIALLGLRGGSERQNGEDERAHRSYLIGDARRLHWRVLIGAREFIN